VRDHDGNAVASAALGDTPWQGTAGLYYAELKLTAPDAAGLYAWQVVAPAVVSDEKGGADAPDGDTDETEARGHEEVSARFNVRAAPAPECRLTVIAIDRESQSPVSGAKVVVHPYRAFTDARGVAEVRVPKGAYRLFVSGRDHFPFRADGEVTADLTITAELSLDLGPSDAELWS
jgi:hypothetical protein